MPTRKYAIRVEENGTCTVYDVETELPVVVNSVPQIGLEVEDAKYLVDLLRRTEREAESSTKQ